MCWGQKVARCAKRRLVRSQRSIDVEGFEVGQYFFWGERGAHVSREHSDARSEDESATSEVREDDLHVGIAPLFTGDDEVRCGFVGLVGYLLKMRCEETLSGKRCLTSVIGRPRHLLGYGVDEGVCVPCKCTTTPRRSSSCQMGSNTSSPT